MGDMTSEWMVYNGNFSDSDCVARQVLCCQTNEIRTHILAPPGTTLYADSTEKLREHHGWRSASFANGAVIDIATTSLKEAVSLAPQHEEWMKQFSIRALDSLAV